MTRFLLYEVKPAVKLQKSQGSTGNSSRFRQLVQSYWRSVTSDASTPLANHTASSIAESKMENEYRLDSTLTNDIVGFVCNSEITDVETLRRSISSQVK